MPPSARGADACPPAAPDLGASVRLLQLHDSQFPTGAFAHSNGLEAYAQDGIDASGLRDLLAAQLAFGWGRLDLSGWVQAWHDPATDALDRLGAEMSAWKPVPGLRSASLRLGARTVKLIVRLWPELEDLRRLAHPHQAIVAGAAGRRVGLPLRDGVLAFAYATLGTSLNAATRCMPLSPERAQEIAVELTPALVNAATRAIDDPVGSFWSAVPGADLAAHRQASLTTRLFQS